MSKKQRATRAFRARSASPADVRHRQILREERLCAEADRLVSVEERALQRVRQCMGARSIVKPHIQRNHWSHWEMRYLSAGANRNGIPDEMYRADHAARFCASDPATCSLSCAGCRG